MKKLLYLFLAITIISCGGDDDSNGNSNQPQTFLEKYDSVVWENTGSAGDRAAFINNPKTLAIYYDACFIYSLEGATETPDGDTVTISIQDETENSISLLTQSAFFPEDNGLFIFTVTSDGNTQTLTRRIDGDIDGLEDVEYIRTNFEVCF